MGKSVDSPPPRDLGKEYRDTLEAQIDLAPELFAAESNPDYGRGAEAQLDLSVLRDTIMGVNGQPGLIQLYEEETIPGLARADAASRRIQQESDIQSIEELGPRATEAAKAANPQQQALIDELNAQAMSELQAGNQLDPGLARQTQQAIRTAQADRGMGFGIGDVSAEALFSGQAGENLKRQRQQFATNVVGINSATTADPFMAILGRAGVNPNAAIGVSSQGQSMNPGQVFNPESAYAGSLYANNFNAKNNAATAQANANAGVIGGTLGALGNLGGSALGNPNIFG